MIIIVLEHYLDNTIYIFHCWYDMIESREKNRQAKRRKYYAG
jgi:hypothetical protein